MGMHGMSGGSSPEKAEKTHSMGGIYAAVKQSIRRRRSPLFTRFSKVMPRSAATVAAFQGGWVDGGVCFKIHRMEKNAEKAERLSVRDVCLLRTENRQLKKERGELIRIVGAALVLMRDIDADTFQTFEAAELVAECLDSLPEQLLDEAMSLCRP